MADNTCHFGINNFFADNSLLDLHSWLYFPSDAAQMDAIIKRVFFDKGLRFVFSTRSKVPPLLREAGKTRSFEDEYDSVRCGMMTWVLPFVPSVPDSSSGFSKKTQRWSMYRPEDVLVLFGSKYHTR